MLKCWAEILNDRDISKLVCKEGMAFLLSLLLPFLIAIIVVGATAAMWRGTLPSAWSYMGLALLVVLGVHRVVQVGAEVVKLFTSGGYFLEHQKQPGVVEMAERSLTLEAVIISVLVVAFSLPLLGWLRTLLSR